ncbi:MAG TPA: 23S rRNA (uracil(1939)-C(5))-methyltransferase RlmD [Bacteroidales bacterium]|nr:23S rRNA (uracil(1939)-C(5))-methyltransferase RlmD [Bacteroidales bacterium]
MSRKKELPILEKVRITDIGAEGNAIARVDNMVLFVPMLIPGDVVDVKVVRKRKKYLEGRAVKFHEYSSDRITPRCSHFGVCGGCRWQHLPYRLQLKYKEQQVIDSLQRIGRVELPEIKPVIGSGNEYFYRNKLEFTFSDRRWLTFEEVASGLPAAKEPALGFHIPGLFDKVLDINECFLQPEPSNAIRNSIRKYAIENDLSFFDLKEQGGFLRNVIIRNTLKGNLMLIVVLFHEDREKREKLLDFLAASFPGISSLFYVINSKKNSSLGDQEPVLYRGQDHITEEMDGLSFRIGPKSFYQTNTCQGIELYRVAKEFAGLTGIETVYDLYTGTGTIACYLAGSASKVVGIEYVDEAVQDARVNAGINGINNTMFLSGDMKNVLTQQLFENQGYPDVIITDPPRAGMHDDVTKAILNSGAERIVYVSCNPATQARDISLLAEGYYVADVQPVDMFPHTHHVENVVLLRRNK